MAIFYALLMALGLFGRGNDSNSGFENAGIGDGSNSPSVYNNGWDWTDTQRGNNGWDWTDTQRDNNGWDWTDTQRGNNGWDWTDTQRGNNGWDWTDTQ